MGTKAFWSVSLSFSNITPHLKRQFIISFQIIHNSQVSNESLRNQNFYVCEIWQIDDTFGREETCHIFHEWSFIPPYTISLQLCEEFKEVNWPSLYDITSAAPTCELIQHMQTVFTYTELYKFQHMQMYFYISECILRWDLLQLKKEGRQFFNIFNTMQLVEPVTIHLIQSTVVNLCYGWWRSCKPLEWETCKNNFTHMHFP